MINKKILIGAAILILVFLAYYYYYSSSSTPTTTVTTPPTTTVTTPPTPTVTTITTPATGTTPGTTVTVPSNTTTTTTLTAPMYKMSQGIVGVGVYSPNCSGTQGPGYCILPQADAISKCSGDPSCTGYGYASGAPDWIAKFPGAYQLFSGTAMNANPQWTTWVKQ